MNIAILMGSPRADGNTAALVAEFVDECGRMGVETQVIPLYDKAVNPCLGCMACQEDLEGLGCVQDDDFGEIFQSMAAADVVVLATPIYSFFCTAPMKALLDRAVYAGTKNYGRVKGPALLEGKRLASIVTCGYPVEKGADLWEEGLKRFCRHGKLEYMGMFCRRDHGGGVPFLNEERAQAVRDFAQAVRLAIQVDAL